MEFDRRTSLARTSNAATTNSTLAPGKRTLTEQLPVQRREGATLPGAESGTKAMVPSTPAPLPAAAGSRPTLQMLFGFRPASAEDPAQVHAAAARGTTTPTTELPYADQIQRSFGRHDISGIKAHVGGDAAASARTMGAEAYATGNHVVLGRGTDLHTVAHEAAHVVQQRGGVQLKSGVGEVEDQHEQHADAVADRVARGESTEALLDMYVGERSTPAGPATEGVQRRQIVPDADLRARVRGLPALIDTKTFTAGQLEDLLQLLEDAREDRRIFPATTAGRETFQQLISDITMELVDAIATHDYKRDGAGAQSPSLGSGSLSSSAALSPSLGSGSLSLSPGASALSPDSLFTPAEPKAPQAQAREMDGLDALFGKLVQLFPPEKFAYIGLGNSPVMLMIYLKLRYGADASVLALPLSAVGEEGFADHAKDSAAQKRVLAYMGQYLDPRALAGRQPLLLDYAAGGASLAIAGLYVRNFFVSRGYKALAKALMLVALSPGSKPRVVDAPPMPSQKIPTIGGLAEDVDGEPQGRVANRELYLRGLEDQRWKRDFGFGMWDKQGCDFEAVNRGDTIAGKFDATKFGRTATGVEAFHENNREGPGDAGARDPSVYLESQFWRALDKEIAATGGDASQLTAILLSLTRDQHRRLHDAYRHDIDLVLGYEGRVPEPIQRKVMAILDSGVASHGGPPSRERKPEPTDSKHVATASASDMPASASLSSSSPSSSLAKPPAMELSAAQPAFFAVTGTDLSGHFTSEVAAAIRRDAAKGDSRGVYCDNDGHSWKISEWMQSVDFYQFKPA